MAMTGDVTSRGVGPMPDTVALFVSCIGDLAAPGPVRASVEVLEAMGVRVVVPLAQTCCGQAALNSGYPAQALPLAQRWLTIFGEYDAIVGPSGSCVATVHHQYPRVLPGAAAARAHDVAARTFEFSQFVAAYGDRLRFRLTGTATYHDSCHMLRSLGERATPRDLLARVEGLELVEMVDADVCCGFGGTFSLKFPDVSVAMADDKLDSAGATGAHYLVSGDPGCLLHLQSRATSTGRPVVTRHLAELLRDALVRTEVPA